MKQITSKFLLGWLALLFAFALGGGTAGAATLNLSPSGITYASSSGNYVASATFSSTPVVTVVCDGGVNNMDKRQTSTYLLWHSGSSQSSNYTLSVPSGYVITGYTITGEANTNDQTLTPSGGSATTFTSGASETVTVTGLNAASASFTLAGANSGLKITAITVTYTSVYTVSCSLSGGGVTYSSTDYTNGSTIYADNFTAADLTAISVSGYTGLVSLSGNDVTVEYIATALPAKNVSATPVFTLNTYNRGGVYYNSSAADYVVSSTKSGYTTTIDGTNADHQFAFVIGNLGQYLYNVGGARFVNEPGVQQNVALTTSVPVGTTIAFEAGSQGYASRPTYLKIGNNHLAISNGFTYGVIGWNAANDDGTNWGVVNVGTADLTTVYASVKTAELAYIDALLANVGTLGYPKTSSTAYTDLVALRTSIFNETNSASAAENMAKVTAYQNETDVVLPENHVIYAINGYVAANLSIDGSTVHNLYLYNNNGTLTESKDASATEVQNLWMAEVSGSTVGFRSAVDGTYLNATATAQSATSYTYTISHGTAHPYFALYNSSLGGGRNVGVGYRNSTYQFGTTGSANFYGQGTSQNSDWSTDFQLTANTNYTTYTVAFSGVPYGETPTLTYGGWTGVADGGIFVAPTNVATNDITSTAITNYDYSVSVSGSTVTVTYTAQGVALTFADGSSNAVNVAVNGNSAAAYYVIGSGSTVSSISTSGSNYVTYTLNGTAYYGNNNPALLAALNALTEAATITVTTATGDITVTDVNGTPLNNSTAYFIKNVGNSRSLWTDETHIAGRLYPWATVYRYGVEGAGSLITIKNLWNNKYLASSDISNGGDKVFPTATTADGALVLKANNGSTTNGFALTPAGNNYLNLYGGNYDDSYLGFWAGSLATDASNTWQFVPVRMVAFEDAGGSAVSMDGTVGGRNFTGMTEIAYPVSDSWTAVAPAGSTGVDYSSYILGSTSYYGRNVVLPLNALTSDATVTVGSAPTGALTVTSSNGYALSPDSTYFLYNVGTERYAWAADDQNSVGPQQVFWADNYRYTVEGTGSRLIIKSVSANKYLATSDISNGATKITPTATTATGAMVLNAESGSTTNGFALTPAGNDYLNFFAGGNLGFWAGSAASQASNTWKFVPALRVDFLDTEGNAVNVRATIAGKTLGYDRTDISFPMGAAWTALDATAATSPYVVQYTLNGTTYDSRNLTDLYTALAALTANDTVTVQYSGDITVLDTEGNELEEGKNYYIKLPGRGDYYLRQNSDTKVRPMAYAGAANQLYQVKGWGNYLAISLPYDDGYYLGASLSAASGLNAGTDKVSRTNNAAQILRFRADAQTIDGLSYTYSLEAACATTTIKSTYFSNHSGVSSNMGFYKAGGATDGGSYFQFVPAIQVTVQNSDDSAVPVTVDGNEIASGIFYKPVGRNLSTFLVNGLQLGSSTSATVTVGSTSNSFTGVDNILAALNALTDDATLTLSLHTVTFKDAVADTTMQTVLLPEGTVLSMVPLAEDNTNIIATFTYNGTVYDARYRADLYSALAANDDDAIVSVYYAKGAFSTLDSRGTALTNGGYYFLELVGRNTGTAEYFASLDASKYIKPVTSFSVAEHASNKTLVQVLGGSAANDSKDYFRLAVPSQQNAYIGTNLSALAASSNYDNIVTNPNSETDKVFTTSTAARFITFRSDAYDASTYKYGLQVVGSNSGAKVQTYLSNIYGSSYRLGFYNVLNDGGTYLQFVPAIKVSFVDPNGIPVKVNVNDEDHANGIIYVPFGHELDAFTPPIRLATYTIGAESGLTSQQVIERTAGFTSDTQITCNAYYTLKFVDESNNVIQSTIHAGSVSLPQAETHNVGMGCVLTNILLDGHTALNYTYVLDGEEYDIISLYSALHTLDVAQGALVTITVKENTSAITVKDINGNPVVAGKDYYVVFPGRSNYYFGSNGAGKTNYTLKLNSSSNYAEPTGNPRLFQVEGNGNYIRLKASRNNMTPSPITAANGGTNVFYVASNDVTNGYDKVSLMNNVDYALVLRAEEFTNYTNCYALRVANHNGILVSYLSNYSGTAYENMGFKGNADVDAYLQFVPYSSGMTLNFKNADGTADLPVTVYRNQNNNENADVLTTAASTYTFNVSAASDKNALQTQIQEGRYLYFNESGVSLNVVKYRYNSTDYTDWADVISAGASAGGTVEVWLTTDGLTTLYDINGNPVVAGKTYRLRRYQTRNLQSSGNDATVRSVTTTTADGTQFWKAAFAGNYMTLTCNDQSLYADGTTAKVGTGGTAVNFSVVEVDRVNHFYYFGTNDVNSTYTHFADAGNTENDFGFHTTANAAGAKFAFVPAGGVSDAFGAELVADRPYRIEMPAKVGQESFPAKQPVTLTLTEPDNNNSVTETRAMAASVEQYNTYYWLPDTYTGLKYMYNEKQVWEVELIDNSNPEGGYRLKSANGYVKVASYQDGAGITVNNALADATAFYGEAAQYEGLTSIYGLYTRETSSSTKFYLCARNTTPMVLSSAPMQSASRWFADCVFRFTPVKQQTLATAYTNGNVVAKGFDCYGPGKTAKGLVWNSGIQEYEESPTAIIETHDMLRGLGDKNDSIVGYHLPDPIYLAYDYGTGAYQETVDFTAPSLIGYKASKSSAINTDGYYEFKDYEVKNYPIVASPAPKISGGAYVFDPNTNWYMIVLRDLDDKLIINSDLVAGTNLSSLSNPFVDKYLFCFVGDSINGYLVYNKARGASHFMGPIGDQAHWFQAQNAVWIENNAQMTDAKRNKSRIVFQILQHDHNGYITFVDRYTGFGLDRWNGHVVYWHGRPTKGGNNYADNASGSNITTDYQKTQLGVVPNSFYRGSNKLEARCMGFPSVATTYARLLKNAVESGYLTSLVGYVGLFRSEADIIDRYNVYLARVAAAAQNTEYTDAQYHAELSNAYKDFFNWLDAICTDSSKDYYGQSNGVDFQYTRYYYLQSVATDEFLAVVPTSSNKEGASSYTLSMTSSPQTTPGAVWQFNLNNHVDLAYKSELGSTYKLCNNYWNANLQKMDTLTANSTALLLLNNGSNTSNEAIIDVFNDMTVMENPGQYVLRTAGGGYLEERDTCFSLINNRLVARAGRVGAGQRRWYLKPLHTETSTVKYNASTDPETRVENYSTIYFTDSEPFTEPNMLYHDDPIAAEDRLNYVYTTYCNPDRNVAYPHNSGIMAFRADYYGDQKEMIHLVQLANTTNNVIPKGMAVVLRSPNKKNADAAYIPMLPADNSLIEENGTQDNLFVGVGTPDNEKVYSGWAFVYKNSEPSGSPKNYKLYFYKIDETKGYTFKYHKAYVPGDAITSSRALSLAGLGFSLNALSGEVTAIPALTEDFDAGADREDNATYDVQGRRVNTPTQPGVYIINGRKVYVK